MNGLYKFQNYRIDMFITHNERDERNIYDAKLLRMNGSGVE